MHRDLDGYEADTFEAEIAGAESRAQIDFCFHLALMTAEQIARAREFAAAFSITSFKLFMAYKGEEGHQINIQGVDDGLLYEAFEQVGGVPGGVVLVHAENQELAARAAKRCAARGATTWARSPTAGRGSSRPRPSSATRERKAGSIWDAQLAFPGIATILPVMLDEGYHRRGASVISTGEM